MDVHNSTHIAKTHFKVTLKSLAMEKGSGNGDKRKYVTK